MFFGFVLVHAQIFLHSGVSSNGNLVTRNSINAQCEAAKPFTNCSSFAFLNFQGEPALANPIFQGSGATFDSNLGVFAAPSGVQLSSTWGTLFDPLLSTLSDAGLTGLYWYNLPYGGQYAYTIDSWTCSNWTSSSSSIVARTVLSTSPRLFGRFNGNNCGTVLDVLCACVPLTPTPTPPTVPSPAPTPTVFFPRVLVFSGGQQLGNMGGRSGVDSICVSASPSDCESTQTFAIVSFPGETPSAYGVIPATNQSFSTDRMVFNSADEPFQNTWANMFTSSEFDTSGLDFVTAGVFPPSPAFTFYYSNVQETSPGVYDPLVSSNDYCAGFSTSSAAVTSQLAFLTVYPASPSGSGFSNCAQLNYLLCACLPIDPTTSSPTTASPTVPTFRTRSPTTQSCNRAARRLRSKPSRPKIKHFHHPR